MRTLSVLTAACLALSLGACNEAPPPAGASEPPAPSAANERNPLDLRRTTLLVRDLEASLALYRDALGMTVSYDQMITSRDGSSQSRLVLLKANDERIGMLGLWQLADAGEAPPPNVPETGFATGEIVLLFNTQELDTVFPAAAAVPGVRVMSEPSYREYPGDGMTFQVMVSMLRDPDGHIVELNRMIHPPLQWD
ncbi:VOC family protein [Alkalicaulis satelles]|uniref:VOC family protein n=2 Tax=Alkalicaulis satelles TaxID=2609175 RepID=A0A5M6ZPG7_9PROT|nr:VOC family protein [Alkalicaulis satelles]